MGIAEELLERATLLMGEQAKMTKTLEALEEQRARVHGPARDLPRARVRTHVQVLARPCASAMLS
jgi:hypothetical protein